MAHILQRFIGRRRACSASSLHSFREFSHLLNGLRRWSDSSEDSFDAELTEKVSHTDPNLTATSFRFLQLFGIKRTAAAPLSQEAARERGEGGPGA